MTDENVTPMPEEPAAAPPAAPVPEPAVEAAPEAVAEVVVEPAAPPAPPAPEPFAPPAAPAEQYAPPPPPVPPAPPAGQYAPPAPPQQGYAQPGYAAPAAATSDKSKVVAGILGILLGSLGIHKFYLGYNKEGIIMLLVTLLTFGFLGWIIGVIGLVEGIMYLTKTDADFEATYVYGRKAWF